MSEEEVEEVVRENVEPCEHSVEKPNKGCKNVIKAMDSEVTHRICSGQVIVTLSTAVKELVENSLDAGAKSIEIRLVEYGSKVIDVKDNGRGVEESNFSGLALKHHTSKLSQFEDLESIGTFGFRGEALSSLCALANLTVTTRHEESRQGVRIEYDSKGAILTQATVARQIGTTVTLKNIFSPLPVRHKEFLKNLKREFNKMVNVLYGYCFVATGVRISCTNELKSSNGLSSKVLCVPASETSKERVAHIFGAKQLTLLVDIEETGETDEMYLTEFGLTGSSFEESRYRLSGVISGPNSGRSAPDRQFFFVNSRPCESVKIGRLVNEVYHAFSRSQYPFICLNMSTEQENVDVNVTPDKRTVYLQNEKILYAKLKGALLRTLTKASCNFSPRQLTLQQTTLNFSPSASERRLGDDDFSEDDDVIIDEGSNISPQSNSTQSPLTLSREWDPHNSDSLKHRCDGNTSRENVRSYLSKFKFGSNANVMGERKEGSMFSGKGRQTMRGGGVLRKQTAKQSKLMDFAFERRNFSSSSSKSLPEKCGEDDDSDVEIIEESTGDMEAKASLLFSAPSEDRLICDDTREGNDDCGTSLSESPPASGSTCRGYVSDPDESDDDCGMEEELSSKHLQMDWQHLLDNSSNVKKKCDHHWNKFNEDDWTGRRFRAKISPDDNNSAESELKKQLTKEMFNDMTVIGQFNLGFIITKLGSDLFIIDQHAADEKFNYEDLEMTTVLQGQRLIIPMSLQLPAMSENILMENLSVFEKNGFSFNVRENAQPTERVSLTKIPYSKSCQFGKQDIEELIFLLEDAPEKSFYRPMKVKTMLASRACRKSVMIGDKLSSKEMGRVVWQLSKMEQPWNCPHGRPTLRHLFHLELMPASDWFKFEHLDAMNTDKYELTQIMETSTSTCFLH